MPQSFSITDIGLRREMNQDYVFSSDLPLGSLSCLYLVADGMGGHRAGDLASKLTVETVVNQVASSAGEEPEELLREAFKLANTKIRQTAARHREYYGMGTTLVCCTICGEELLVANVGDSRLYNYTEKGFMQITIDHSLVEEMVRAGTLDRRAARVHPERNVITRAIGAEDEMKVDFFRVPLSECGLILMCSDGLYSMIDDGEIESVLSGSKSLEEKAAILIALANRAGGKDNSSVILIDTSGDKDGDRTRL